VSTGQTDDFLREVVAILLDYIRESNDPKSLVVDFHHPAELKQLLEHLLPVGRNHVGLDEILGDCRETLKYCVRTGRQIFSQPGSDGFRSRLMFYCWCFFFFLPWYLWASSVDRCEIFYRGLHLAKFYKLGSKIWRGSFPQKSLGAKTYRTWSDFERLQSLTANIPGTDEDIWNRTSTCFTAIPSALVEKVRWTPIQ